MNTEELHEFSTKSKAALRQSISLSIDNSHNKADKEETVDDIMARWVTEDECAICCTTLKDTEVLVMPVTC